MAQHLWWVLIACELVFGVTVGLLLTLPDFVFLTLVFLSAGAGVAAWRSVPPSLIAIALLCSILTTQTGYALALCVRLMIGRPGTIRSTRRPDKNR